MLEHFFRRRKKRQVPFEPWSPYREGDEPDAQQIQPLPVIGMSAPAHESPQQRYRRLKALSDATGERLLFVCAMRLLLAQWIQCIGYQ
ncbi:MAG: hypothetical protein JO202_17620 [Ktedonobacteraceae bacterium]|nr:hypothetical protein [Ktedonobacteraceae bacterium]